MLQRSLSLGYNAASRLVDELERIGVVGEFNGAAPREILINDINEVII